MKFRQSSQAKMTKRSSISAQVLVSPFDNIFEPRDDDIYPNLLNSTANSLAETKAKNKFHGISKPTKKQAISNIVKPKMNNLNIKPVKSSPENIFNLSVRLLTTLL